jgi:hypothetical protein
MNKTLLYVTQDIKSASSYYRGYGELVKIKKYTDNSFNIKIASNLDWYELADADAVFMERPFSPSHLSFLMFAQAEEKKVWVDFDDHLGCVPSSNEASKLYKDTDVKTSLTNIIGYADIVTCSTSRLLDEMVGTPSENTIVIQNGIAKDKEWIQQARKINGSARDNIVLWRGTHTHQKDLLSFASQIVETANSNHAWKFDFMGYNPWFITDYIPYWQFKGGVSLRDYFWEMAMMTPSIIIVPLFDDDFNRCKSNIAALEASWLTGANVIAPDWPEWQIDGWMKYKDQEDFRRILMEYLNNGYNHEDSQKAIADIENKYTDRIGVGISPQNQQRLEILKQLEIL